MKRDTTVRAYLDPNAAPGKRATLETYLSFFDEDLQAALFLQEALRRQSLVAHFRALLDVGVAQHVVDDAHRLALRSQSAAPASPSALRASN